MFTNHSYWFSFECTRFFLSYISKGKKNERRNLAIPHRVDLWWWSTYQRVDCKLVFLLRKWKRSFLLHQECIHQGIATEKLLRHCTFPSQLDLTAPQSKRIPRLSWSSWTHLSHQTITLYSETDLEILWGWAQIYRKIRTPGTIFHEEARFNNYWGRVDYLQIFTAKYLYRKIWTRPHLIILQRVSFTEVFFVCYL